MRARRGGTLRGRSAPCKRQLQSRVVALLSRAFDGVLYIPQERIKGTVRGTCLAHVLRGIAMRRLHQHGVSLPARAEPFTAQEKLKMLRIPEGAKVGSRTYESRSRFWAGWRLVDTYASQAGARKKEFVGDEHVHPRRAHHQRRRRARGLALGPELWLRDAAG